MAHATSLAVIVPTALAGVVSYHRAGLVVWRIALPTAGVAIAAALAGVHLAIRLPPEALKAGFALFLVASGLNLLGSSRRPRTAGKPPGWAPLLAFASGVGLITALLGVGGGLVAIPVLIYFVRLDMKEVAATSLGIVVFSSLSAAITYGVAGWGNPVLPAGSVGYIFAPAALALLPGAVLTARVGARINQRMDDRALKLLFGVLFLLVGIRLFLANVGAVRG
jgi:hypothetical protein